ncbi:reverse transcriptase domain-containing protein, partial [Saccharopolyspora sp. NPDC000995]
MDLVRALQHTLYRAAKADPGCRFHALRDKVFRRDVLWCAWVGVHRNDGAPGFDNTTLADVKQYGVTRLLDELASELKDGTYRPMAARVFIPKPGTAEQRPLSIPSVRDRIVQTAMKIVLEPIFEADMLPCSFGFRPKRSAHDALQVLIDEAWRGRRWVVETDIANCFSAIPHEKQPPWPPAAPLQRRPARGEHRNALVPVLIRRRQGDGVVPGQRHHPGVFQEPSQHQ